MRFCYRLDSVSVTSSDGHVLDQAGDRRQLIERILRTADELERRARALPVVLVLATRAGALRVSGRERVLIGRDRRCDIVLSDRRVSRFHAALVRSRGHWFIEDLGSRNGTRCGGKRLARRLLEDGDVVEIGEELIRVRLHVQ